MTDERQTEFYAKLNELTTEQVLSAFIDWHGTQLLTERFYAHVCNEYFDGYDEPEEEVEADLEDYEEVIDEIL